MQSRRDSVGGETTAVVARKGVEDVSNAIISNIISVLLTNDDVYDVESDE